MFSLHKQCKGVAKLFAIVATDLPDPGRFAPALDFGEGEAFLEVGLAVAIRHWHGEPVVDLVAALSDRLTPAEVANIVAELRAIANPELPPALSLKPGYFAHESSLNNCTVHLASDHGR